MRPRKYNTDLPRRLMLHCGKYYYVTGGKWHFLSADRQEAIQTAERFNRLKMEDRAAAVADARETCAAVREFVLQRDGHRCVYCGATEALEVDHVIPASQGGASTHRNLVAACATCNALKGDGDLADFMVKLHRIVERCLEARCPEAAAIPWQRTG